MTELLSYVFSPLREGDIALYRGSGNGVSPILLAAAEEISFACVERLEHEYALKAELDADWAARPVALTRYNDCIALVLEDPGGEPLDRLLGQPLDVSHFLHIAIPLAGALHRVHERGLIHKDIKPANFLVDATTGGVWLTGFGIASCLPREHQAPAPPGVIAGTLAYMAPEQTGRMNRSVDSRSDLYALGVTFYEMLTGQLPFTAADPMEWVHCHIARRPIPPDELVTGILGPLSAIVTKLLAKTAEERYQTAAGVEADLRRCLAEWEAHGRIDPFLLGAYDVSDRLLIPEKLYGREREIDALLASFDRVVANGTPEIVLVSGDPGIGKSSVVNQVHMALVPPRGLFASAKFDQYKRDIPYATFAQASQTLVRRILGESEAELRRWREALREALGPNGQLIVNLAPELELVIGKQPSAPDLPPRDAQNRFHLVFRRFLGVFARKEHPLALFLDDLQWLDAATLDLLEHLATHSEVQHLLLVGAYRGNEIHPSHPLLRALEAIRKAGAQVHEVVLAPLGLDDVGQLIADTMNCEPERVRVLAQLVQEKTAGNPFFVIQFLTALAEEGLLAFDPIMRAWQWDIDRIPAMNYADNVVDLMAGKLKRLSSTTQEVLKQLACLGNVVEFATLALVGETTEEAMHAALWEAVRAGLVFHQKGTYKFLHDRIQQAAYSLIPDEQCAYFHLRIGRVLLANLTADELAEHLFDVAHQHNRGAARLVDRDEKVQTATMDLRAGRQAKASAAYGPACAYLAAGMALLDDRDWGNQHELAFALWLERAECELLTGDLDTAEQLMVELLQRALSKIDQAAAYHLKVQFYVMKSEHQQAVTTALTCLRLFGIDLPTHPTWEQVLNEYESVWQTLNGRPIESLLDLPVITDPELQAASQILSVLTAPAYFTDFHLWCLLACRKVKVSMQHGTNGASAHAYSSWGSMLGPIFHRYGDAYRFVKLARDLVEKHGFIGDHAKIHYAMGTVAFWTQPIATAIAVYEKDERRGLAVEHDGRLNGLFVDEPGYPGDLESLISSATDFVADGRALATGNVVDLDSVHLLPPLSRPGKIVCIGLNYKAHSAEAGFKLPTYPTVFARFTSSLMGHGDPIILPPQSSQLDYEGELVAIIGRRGHNISAADALGHVAGYSIFNDATLRDFQFRTPQWTMGKNFDGTGAFGPFFVPAAVLPPGCKGLHLQTRLNHQVVQDASISDLVFDVQTLIVLLSEVFTLEAGDLIVTGTPAGVGMAREPKLWMRPGDVCEIEISDLGVLRNSVAKQARESK